jgi:hypothetical protein
MAVSRLTESGNMGGDLFSEGFIFIQVEFNTL